FQLPPFNDVRARQALALLVDQDEMMPAVAGDDGKWSACHSFSVCGSTLGTEAGSEPYRRADIAKARQLLAEAGYRGE
ncbi:ABC transporter substrate-binding protein, partial [Serratia marcescens]|uniref:ABC transporter substrate-binding protein n=1 Tax=Serratia marcescens TaxID=615 RepID=UPI001EF806B1